MKKKQNKSSKKKDVIKVCVEVEFVPFPSKEAKDEAYRTHVKLFLRGKGRGIKKCKK